MSFHRRTLSLFALITTLLLGSACTPSGLQPDSATKAVPLPDTLVTAKWLNEQIGDPDLVILDCTVVVESDASGAIKTLSGRNDYDAAHIPTAGFADLKTDLSDPNNPLPEAMPTVEQFVAAMSALGVDNNSRVVLYDANHSVWAARVWWMLRWIGFDNAAILDGGLDAWKAEGLALSADSVNRTAGKLTANVRENLIADQDEVRASIGKDNVMIIDAMPEPHYHGLFAMYARPGHISSASSMPAFSLLDESGHYRSIEELDMMHDGDRDSRAITYCGGGIAASSNAFIMHRIGFSDVAVYMGSLQEWTMDPDNPMEK